jgi:hypothetical protein
MASEALIFEVKRPALWGFGAESEMLHLLHHGLPNEVE